MRTACLVSAVSVRRHQTGFPRRTDYNPHGTLVRILPLLLLALAACAQAPVARPAPSPADAEVVAVAQRLFDAMRTRDTAAVRGLFRPQGRVIGMGQQGGETAFRDRSVDEFIASVAASPEALIERMWDAEVRISPPLATLWAPYDFHRGERFSHCGFDAFQMVRVNGEWRITALSYTMQAENCPPAPPRREP